MKYDFELNVALENNSHTQLISRVPDHSCVLEVGCATGYMSNYLTKQKKCKVVGIELDSASAKRAEAFCEKVICANVEDAQCFHQLEKDKFDVILCADILEHLRDPIRFLKKIQPFLKRNTGRLIASVPNGAHVSLRLELLAGTFTYENTGLLDRTHLHLFTHSSVRALFARAGYQVDELSYTFHDIPDPVIHARLKPLGLSATDDFYQLMHQPESAAYQYIISATLNHDQNTTEIAQELTDKPMLQSWDFYYNFRDAYTQLEQEKEQLIRENEQLKLIYNGLPFRLSQKIKKTLRLPKRLITHFKTKKAVPNISHRAKEIPYHAWIRKKEPLSLSESRHMKEFLSALNDKPLISIIMPVYNTDANYLRQAIQSVCQQSYPKWQLCIADDASTVPHVRTIINDMQKKDQRIKIVFRKTHGYVVKTSNSALKLADGEYVGFMDHDDLLAKDALYHVVKAIHENPKLRLIYSDEDKIDQQGQRFGHYFKPDYNPDLMYSQNILDRFGVYQRQLLEKLGGFRQKYQGAQNYDLAFRVIEQIKPHQIKHISRILYHWRTLSTDHQKPYVIENSLKVVTQHLIQQGYKNDQIDVRENPYLKGTVRVKYQLPKDLPLVSLIIPTKNAYDLLKQCIESIQKHTNYARYEIIIIDNQSDQQQTIDYMQGLVEQKQIKLISYNKPFNYSAINNLAVEHAKGELLAFINNDIEVIEAGWLEEMVSQALRPDIGAVGCRLWYPNDQLQHGGVVLGLGGVAGHAMKNISRHQIGYNGRAVLTQNYSAVTAACLVMRKSIFKEINGFNEKELKVAFNDVDFCLRIGELGLRIVWTPFANLYHHESATRGNEDTPEKKQRFQSEIDYMLKRWGAKLAHDPAYNQNLTHSREDFSLNW